MKNKINPKEKLIKKLEFAFGKLGIFADNIKITFPEGFWKKADVYRWEGTARLSFQDGRPVKNVNIVSWDTATECVKLGDLLIQEKCPWEWEIHSPASLVC